jgi:hypothetical protein
VIVADDGSSCDTGEAIERTTGSLPVPAKHVWQEHRGFRAAEVRNRGVAASRGTYAVFLDGDCVPRSDFVAAHRRLAEPGWFVFGNRTLASRALTDVVLTQHPPVSAWSLARFFRLRLTGDINRLAPLLHLPLGPLRKLGNTQWSGVRTCNLAVWRSDLDAIDGFDARFRGWGLEDSDLAIRLLRNGSRRKDGRFATGVLHLWHPADDRSDLATNEQRLQETLASSRIQAIAGLSSLELEAATGPHGKETK